jgi:hypothetical protein
MAFFTVSGVALPAPSEFEVSVMDLSKAERNANGRMIIERIATKRKLAFSYSYVTADDAADILKQIAPTSYTVTYYDPQTRSVRSGSFYCGDRSLGMMDYNNGNPRFVDLKFNLIEL